MPETAEHLTYSSADWGKVAREMHGKSGADPQHEYPPDLRPFAEHLYEKAAEMDRRPAERRPADGRFTEVVNARDAGYLRRAGRAVRATELPSTDQ